VVAGGLAVSKSVFAAKKSKAIASGLIYSANNAGMWSEKVGSHAPKVEIEGSMVGIKTVHGMSERHYIVRHTLVTENGEVIGSETFYPEDEEAISTHELLADAKGKFYATSFCNKHDFWVTEFEI